MVRLVVVLTVLVVLSCVPQASLAGDIKTVVGQPVDKPFESAIPDPDYDTMQEIDRLLDKVLEGQRVMVPEAAGSRQDNQGDKADGGQGQ